MSYLVYYALTSWFQLLPIHSLSMYRQTSHLLAVETWETYVGL